MKASSEESPRSGERLQKILAQAGVASRRAAEQIILEGRVQVNGQTVTELGTKADPFAVVPPGIRPEWYFLAMFHTLKLVPSHVLGIEGERLGVVAFAVAALFLVLVPFLDRRASRGESSRLFTVLAAGGLIYLVTFTIIGHYAK